MDFSRLFFITRSKVSLELLNSTKSRERSHTVLLKKIFTVLGYAITIFFLLLLLLKSSGFDHQLSLTVFLLLFLLRGLFEHLIFSTVSFL